MKKLAGFILAAAIVWMAMPGTAAAVECTTCGDVNGDGEVDIADLVAFVEWYQWPPGPQVPCPGCANVDCDMGITYSDIYYLRDYMFNGGPPPCDPDNDGEPDCDPCY